MTPVLVKQATDAVVPLAALRSHCNIGPNATEFDVDLVAYHDAAVSWLDGYRGVLGRCIMPQTWRVVYSSAGIHRLPFPDVQTVEVDAGQATLTHDCLGSVVTLTDAATVTLTAQCPPDILASVRQIVKLMVRHWFDHRSAATEVSMNDMPMAVNALLAPIRWVRV